MAIRELSSTLKNLKFMQRAAQKTEETKKDEIVTPAGDFPPSRAVKRCVVVFEADPHPWVARGRMSFLSFKPSVNKLNEEAPGHKSAATSSGRQNEEIPVRENGSSSLGLAKLKLDPPCNDANGDLKRKQAEVGYAGNTNKYRKYDQESQDSSPSSSRQSKKLHKRRNLDRNAQHSKFRNKNR